MGNIIFSTSPEIIPRSRIQNSTKSINKLPPELLSRIFVIGEREERITRHGKARQLTIPDLATQVCSYWRHVAINNPALWTYIRITHPPPHDLAILYLRRAGSVALFDIDIEMHSQHWGETYIHSTDWVRQAVPMSRLVEFLIFHGAKISRWRNLTLSVGQLAPFFRMVSLLNTYSAPALRSLCVEYKTDSLGDDHGEGRSNYAYASGQSYSVSGPALPSLGSVQFVKIPWDYVFERSSPLLTGLTTLSLSLSLAASTGLTSLSKLRELLAANPLLESLSLDSGDAVDWVMITRDITPQCIQLPQLRSLAFESQGCSLWILDLVRMIQAPELERFALASKSRFASGRYCQVARILKYMSTGNTKDENVDGKVAVPADKPIYPMLRELDISRLKARHEDMINMLTSFSSVRRLSMDGCDEEVLGRVPWVLPNLIFLRFHGAVSPQLGDILRRRAAAEFPVQVLELPRGVEQGQFEGQLPRTITVINYDTELGFNG